MKWREPHRPLAWVTEPGANWEADCRRWKQKWSATAMGEETEVADTHKASGKSVEEKAPQELFH